MLKFFKKLKLAQSGFSLLEVITILFIVSIGMVGILSLIVQNIQTERVNRGNLIACQLAQEGLELIREVRDNNWRDGVDWLTNLGEGNYRIDYSMATPTPITTTDEAVLLLEDGFYRTYATGDPESPLLETEFYRVINLDSLSSDSEQVSSVVSWSDRGHAYNCSLLTVLYNWR